jgi:hypothetical protein
MVHDVLSCLENQLKEMNVRGSSGRQPLTPSKVVPVRAPQAGSKKDRATDDENFAKKRPKTT